MHALAPQSEHGLKYKSIIFIQILTHGCVTTFLRLYRVVTDGETDGRTK